MFNYLQIIMSDNEPDELDPGLAEPQGFVLDIY